MAVSLQHGTFRRDPSYLITRVGTGPVAPAGWVTLHGLMKEMPWDWNEQLRRFRLAAGKNDSLAVRD